MYAHMIGSTHIQQDIVRAQLGVLRLARIAHASFFREDAMIVDDGLDNEVSPPVTPSYCASQHSLPDLRSSPPNVLGVVGGLQQGRQTLRYLARTSCGLGDIPVSSLHFISRIIADLVASDFLQWF